MSIDPTQPHAVDPRRPRAIIVVPDDGHVVDRAAQCAAYCRRLGYEMVGVVVGTGPAHWAEILSMVTVRHQAEVVVVPSQDLVPGAALHLESSTQGDYDPQRAAPVAHRRKRRPKFLR